ncbi:hypothetical protein D3C83_121260 [compost metagenome]
MKVASTSSGIFASWAMALTAGMSSTSRPGLPSVSPKSSRVFGRMALAKFSGVPGATKVVSMPKRFMV